MKRLLAFALGLLFTINLVQAQNTWTGALLSGRLPAASIGKEGDWFVDTNAYAFWGPKTSGSWGNAATGTITPALPALTGSCTTVAGTVAVTCEQDGGWTPYTPAVTCPGGGSTTTTTLTGAYKLIGTKTVTFRTKVVLNVNSSCLSMAVTLPLASVGDLSISGRETTAGKTFSGSVGAGNSTVGLFYYDNTNVAANGATFPFNATYDTP